MQIFISCHANNIKLKSKTKRLLKRNYGPDVRQSMVNALFLILTNIPIEPFQTCPGCRKKPRAALTSSKPWLRTQAQVCLSVSKWALCDANLRSGHSRKTTQCGEVIHFTWLDPRYLRTLWPCNDILPLLDIFWSMQGQSFSSHEGSYVMEASIAWLLRETG